MDVLDFYTITPTANIYAHLIDATQRVTVEMMDEVMNALAQA